MRKKDIQIWRGDSSPTITWTMPFATTGFTFTLYVSWPGGYQTHTLTTGLSLSGANDVVWTYTSAESEEIPNGKVATYEMRRESGTTYRTYFYGYVTGMGGLSV